LEAKRDWGHARDYVLAMWLMLQRDSPEDFVVGTGESHSVREFTEIAFRRLGLNFQEHVIVDPTYYRPSEVHDLVADAAKSREKLGWANRYGFAELVEEMVQSDLEILG
jgi:GDPmannose 4,6-dehydratase